LIRGKEGIKKYTFNEGIPLQIEVVNFSILFKKHRELLIKPHRTNFYHIFLFGNCRVKHTVDFKTVSARPNSLLFLNKDCVHQFDANSPYVGYGIIFTDDFYCQHEEDIIFLQSSLLFNDLVEKKVIPMKEKIGEFNTLLLKMQKTLNGIEDEFQPLLIKNYLQILFLEAERLRRKQGLGYIKEGKEVEYLIAFKMLLENHYRTEKQVEYYAAQLASSTKKMTRAISVVLGKTPKSLIDDRVMLEAKRFLSHTQMSIKELGFYLGFNEPTNFIKYFHKHSGKTPLEFRQFYQTK